MLSYFALRNALGIQDGFSPAPYDLHAGLLLPIHIENDVVSFIHDMQVRNVGLHPRHVKRQLDTERYSSPTSASPSLNSAGGLSKVAFLSDGTTCQTIEAFNLL